MDKKQHILSEIKRTAEKNGGKPLGMGQFFQATGIKRDDWLGKAWNDWNRWSDVQAEADYTPNQFQGAYGQDILIEKLITFIRTLGHFPMKVEFKRESARNEHFPDYATFAKNLGKKKSMIEAVKNFCRQTPDEYQDILEICEPLITGHTTSVEEDVEDFRDQEDFGFVYLMKSGKNYKIGCTKALDRRQYEIGIQLPEKIEPIHSIRTDDPSGIETYWHNRFKDKHLNGEWFNLTALDVRVFKKRKFM
ncbi:MAG: GIY-YIG nuclease family protein [Micavibrio sp.]|nr:GIY-YIG nuclease family protein [Micavibrio sp.]